MSTLYITEYADLGTHTMNPLNDPQEPELNTQTVAIGASSTQSSALKNNTQMVRVHTDSICSVLFGNNPTATTSNRRMVAGQTEYFRIPVDSSLKVAVITNT